MKIYRPVCIKIVQAIRDIFFVNKHAEFVVHKLLRSEKKWGGRDRRFAAETIYEVVRWWRLLWGLIELEPGESDAELWKILGAQLLRQGVELPDWPEFAEVSAMDLNKRYEKIKGVCVFRESIPEWLDTVGREEHGESWGRIIHALNQPAQVCLRVNSLKIRAPELQKKLAQENVETRIIDNEALALVGRRNITSLKIFEDGLFEIQDYSSQQVAHFLNLEPGQNVIDACAGGGGKALHIATLLKNEGQVVIMDKDREKLFKTIDRAKRAGVRILKKNWIENENSLNEYMEWADRLLLDVPCSGIGVLRRKPGTKWKLTPEKFTEIKETQSEILNSYSQLLKPGGSLVYSTCSVFPSETTQIIQSFLTRHRGLFALSEEKVFLPSEQPFDGFYMARVKKI